MPSGFEQTKEELQRTVREVFRVVFYRRWAFLIPFCAAASVVLISSHRLPREYKAHTVFERRSPIPISKVLERTGPISLENLHQSIKYDMMGPEAMARVALDLGMDKNWKRDTDGQLTSSARRRLKSTAAGLRGMLGFLPLKTGHDMDRMQISARAGDPEMVVKVVNQVRDNYFEFSRRKFLGRLREAKEFYQREIENLMASIELHDQEIEELESAYPYVNQDTSRRGGQRAVALEVSIDNFERRVEEHQRKISRLEAQLSAMPNVTLIGPGAMSNVPSFLDTGADLERERRRLRDFIQRTENQMMQNRIEKGMLERHPGMQTLMRKREHAVVDLAALDRKLGTPTPVQQILSDDPAVIAVQRSDRQRVVTELADSTAALSVAQGQLKDATASLGEHGKLRTGSFEKRGLYKQMQSSLKDERAHLEDTRADERKLSRVLDIDAKNQGIEFITIEEAETSRRPVSPKSQSILMLAFGVGLAFGACTVFLREFFDHTFHTATSVSFSLGVPVLEGIDEILLPVDRRRILLRKLAMVPVACAFIGVLAVSGGLAYLSLEHPQKFKRIVHKATTTWEQVNVLG